jgi:hypothetical protein
MLVFGLLGCTETIYATPSPTTFPTPTAKPTPAPAPTPTSRPTPTPTPALAIELPLGMGAFRGRVMWVDKPVVTGDVVADTKPPYLALPVWGNYSSQYKQFSTKTDENGYYVLIVDPGKYYIASSLSVNNYLTYETFLGGLFGAKSYDIASGNIVEVNLKDIDWSIKLVSPGASSYTFHNAPAEEFTVISKPILQWNSYDWGAYSGEVGYYIVKVTEQQGNYTEVVNEKTEVPYYYVQQYLKDGEYEWTVEAYTPVGKMIAGSVDDLYFRLETGPTPTST